jgi:putative membrane protein
MLLARGRVFTDIRPPVSMHRKQGRRIPSRALPKRADCLGIERAVRLRRPTNRAIVTPGEQRGGEMILQSLAGLPAFLVYFCTAIVVVVAYLFVYTRVTPHDEFQLIRDNDPAAAIALGLSLLGFVLPVVSAIAHSANIVDCLIWSAIALIVQIVVYYVVKIPVPNLSAKIAAGELGAAIWLGLASLAAGALNAASMIY